MPVVLYGIKNCDTFKKAKNWLTDKGVAFTLHDYRKDGLDSALLNELEAALGWQAMVNKRGTTWRKLPDYVKDNIDKASALSIMLENPAIIKRPILRTDKGLELGFEIDHYQELFSA
ncbi:MAG: arsenate reductase [Cycloclasticus sp. symbiont of Poecilosclerida sp. N]|nr:MAG: arsenate reductase [Cycloclasticus sp. symbiont of Poecilosclerida sp. N]